MLDLQEFSQISGSTMSQLFLERIFEEHVMTRRAPGARGPPHVHGAAKSAGGGSAHRDKMDIIDFTDFVLAWDHRSSPAAIKYFFPIFDLKHQVRHRGRRERGPQACWGRDEGLRTSLGRAVAVGVATAMRAVRPLTGRAPGFRNEVL